MAGWFIVTFLCGAVVGAAYGVYLEHRCKKMLNVAEGLLQSASEAEKKTTDNLEKAEIALNKSTISGEQVETGDGPSAN